MITPQVTLLEKAALRPAASKWTPALARAKAGDHEEGDPGVELVLEAIDVGHGLVAEVAEAEQGVDDLVVSELAFGRLVAGAEAVEQSAGGADETVERDGRSPGGEEAEHGAERGGVDAGFQDCAPGDESNGGEDQHAAHAESVEQRHRGDQSAGQQHLEDLNLAGVEDGDDEDGADVVDDDEGEQHGAQADGHARGEEGGDAEGEGDIGSHGDGPALARVGAVGDQQEETEREQHAADRAGDRGGHDAGVGEFADCDLALDLQPDDEEEEHHRDFVDPEVERALDGPDGEVDADVGVEQALVFVVPGRVGPDQGDGGGDDQEDGAGALGLDEFLHGSDEHEDAGASEGAARIEVVQGASEHGSTVDGAVLAQDGG